jgi:hypothetical protein
MKKLTFICIILVSIFACKEASKNTSTTTPTDKVAEVPTNQGGTLSDADKVAITDAVHNFYKWYETFIFDDKRSVPFINFEGKAAKLDNANLTIYHAELMKSGLISQAFIDSDLTFLKGNEAEWIKNNEDGGDGPLTGMDYERFFCGQDYDIKAYTTGAVKAERFGTNQAKAAIETSKIELVNENGKWLISRISCE